MSAHVLTQGKFPRCSDMHTVVLFDARTGAVHHVHCALLFQSTTPPPSADALEAVARRNAAHCHRKRKLPPLEALHIPNSGLGPGPHRVDLVTRKVVSDAAGRPVP